VFRPHVDKTTGASCPVGPCVFRIQGCFLFNIGYRQEKKHMEESLLKEMLETDGNWSDHVRSLKLSQGISWMEGFRVTICHAVFSSYLRRCIGLVWEDAKLVNIIYHYVSWGINITVATMCILFGQCAFLPLSLSVSLLLKLQVSCIILFFSVVLWFTTIIFQIRLMICIHLLTWYRSTAVVYI